MYVCIHMHICVLSIKIDFINSFTCLYTSELVARLIWAFLHCCLQTAWALAFTRYYTLYDSLGPGLHQIAITFFR